MSRNIEIKARVANMTALEQRASALADKGPVQIKQEDTFFACARGRLKLRKFSDTHGELIYYRRADQAGPKESFYLKTDTSEPDLLLETLRLAYGITGRVDKLRTLYLVGRTRVHLDRVLNLGDFMELEVVLAEHDSTEQGVAEAADLMKQLAVSPDDLIDGAYVDLLNNPAIGTATQNTEPSK